MITAGEKLRSERIRLGYTLDQVEKGTKIKKSFLIAIERSNYDAFPSPAYAQGFVRNYAHFLGISRQEIMPLFKRQYDENEAYDVLPKGFTSTRELQTHRVRIKRSALIAGVVMLFFVVYLVFQFRAFFSPPSLSVYEPKEGSMKGQDVVVVGRTDPNITVYVNTILVSLDADGNFTKHIAVFPGKTTIQITARNRYGKESIVERTIFVKPRS